MKKLKMAMLAMAFLMVSIFSWSGQAIAAASEEPGIAWIYLEPAGNSDQMLVFSMAEVSPYSAALNYMRNGISVRAEAVEIKGKNIAFLIDGVSLTSADLVSLEITAGGSSYTVDLGKFRKASDTDTVKVTGDTETVSGTLTDHPAQVASNSGQIRKALAAAEAQAPVRAGEKSGPVIVVLDPGHGGYDQGATRTWDGVHYIESEIALKIAKYTKAELETYEGVQVYMTRSSDVYVGLYERVEYASSVGASVLISQHINSTDAISSTVTGAEVLISSGNYKSSQAKKTKAIAQEIIASLESIGFTSRGLSTRLSDDGSTYPNGKLSDYYAIVRLSVLAGFPGMIVEHGFISNQSDCEKYFGSNAKLKAVGVADATAIAKYYGLSKKSGTISDPGQTTDQWVEKDGNVYYQYADGTYARGLTTIDGKKYYFNASGVRKTGWKTINGKKYYFSKKKYCAVTGWRIINGKKYYFDSEGIRQKGIFQVGDYYYCANSIGVRKTGWVKKNGCWYYFKPTNGRMIVGRQATIRGITYTFNERGVLVS